MSAAVRRFLQKGGKGGVFFIHGGDEFRKDEVVRAIVDEHVDPGTRDFNFDVLRGGDVDGERLASVLATPPLMAEWRVVVVRDVEALTSSPKVRELLVSLAQAPPPGLAAVLVASVPKGSAAKFWKDLQSKARSLELAPLGLDDVPGWLLERAAALGMNLEEEAAVALSAAVGADLGVLARELEKLTAFVQDGAPITKADVEKAGIRLPAQDRWQWLDLVGGRKFVEAVHGLATLFGQGESGVGLAIPLGTHLLRLGVILEAGPAALEGALPPHQRWLAKRLVPQARGWTADELSDALDGLLRADRLMKSSGVSNEALLEEWLLSQMARPRVAA
ncbi:MAG: DNA polymerase III subunit delta [Gemmatimonadetes bacterium]|nr:DNA polymerase III subunit delta [Gemmatimonadota bacterium]